jgi:hypothetical protein
MSENIQISYFMEIRPLGAVLFHAYGRTDRRDETNSCGFATLQTRLKLNQYCALIILTVS